jgi:hypothetical protein
MAGDHAEATPSITIRFPSSGCNRAAHYRQLITKTSDPRRVNRYRELSQLLDEAAERLERQN